MPFSQPLSYPSPYFWSTQVSRCAHTTCNVLVKETVLKSGVEGGCKAVARKERVGPRFLCTIVNWVWDFKHAITHSRGL